MTKTFSHITQPDQMDCGATCLAMVAKHYGKNYTIQKLREMCFAARAGVSLLGISDAAEKLGFKTMGVKVSFEKLAEEAPLPCIVHCVKRSMDDWMDKPIEKHTQKLSDLAVEFWGDQVLVSTFGAKK